MFLILSHLDKLRFGIEPATAQCWLESDRHFLNHDLGSRTVSARTGFWQWFTQDEMLTYRWETQNCRLLLNPKA